MITQPVSSTLRERVRGRLFTGRPILRAQLAILYSGFFLGLLAIALGAAGLLILRGSQSATANGGQPSGPPPHTALLVVAIGLVAAAIAVTGAWWLAGRFLAPLRAITTAAQEISVSNLHRRLELKGPDDELTQLGRTLDGLFGRLESSFETQRRFVANASHELRTPLAGQRALLQVALSDPNATMASLRDACEQALDLGDRQEQLIEALLTLATSERGIERSEHIDLAEIAATVLTGRRQLAESMSITVEASLAPAAATGDAMLLELLVANLIDNAVRHNVANGTVTVAVTSASGRPVLTVVNTGPLVPEAALEHLFEPFRTTSADRSRHSDGHGLGLAIVRAIADAHDAAIETNARPTGGLEVSITFPRC
ncbi:MAG: sensor histidine kinase [Solirubrobacteraceae bacterium]